jgi:hypothetical protein
MYDEIAERTLSPIARNTPNSHEFSLIFEVKLTNNTKKQIVMTVKETNSRKNVHLDTTHCLIVDAFVFKKRFICRQVVPRLKKRFRMLIAVSVERTIFSVSDTRI